jgi:hypothetical protein
MSIAAQAAPRGFYNDDGPRYRQETYAGQYGGDRYGRTHDRGYEHASGYRQGHSYRGRGERYDYRTRRPETGISATIRLTPNIKIKIGNVW